MRREVSLSLLQLLEIAIKVLFNNLIKNPLMGSFFIYEI